jgi:hypothetical protein
MPAAEASGNPHLCSNQYPVSAIGVILSRIDALALQCMLRAMSRFANIRLARMSSGQHCLIRDLGLVKGGKGLRHHEVVLVLSLRGLAGFAMSRIRNGSQESTATAEPKVIQQTQY